jgi:diguanylate cyclase (GGDEF)-like protein/PAS domain S-box-containing protein
MLPGMDMTRSTGRPGWSPSIARGWPPTGSAPIAASAGPGSATASDSPEGELLLALAAVAERERLLRAAEELAQLGSWVWSVGSDTVLWSDELHRILGADLDEPPVSSNDYLAMVHPDDLARVLAVIRVAERTGGSYEVDHRMVRRDGLVVEVRGRGRAELDGAGRPVRLVGGLQDITEMKASARELQRSRDLFAGVLDAATEQSIIATDPQGLITVFNTGAERMLGYRAEEMIGASPERLHDQQEIAARAAELGVQPGFGVFLVQAAAGHPETRQWTYLTRDGRRLLASITVTAMHGPDGEITGYIKVGTDITERVQAQAALQESEQRFRDLFQHAPNGMMLFGIGADNLGRFLKVNPAMTELTGYSEQQLLGMPMAELVAPVDRVGYDQRLAAFHVHPVLDAPAERHWIHADGRDLWVQLNISPGVSNGDGAYVVGQVEDITARKQAEAMLRHQALHDGLTGLPNRILLMDRIEHALAVTSRTNRLVGVLYLDLDGFKAVNDSSGHAVGDQALIHVGHQISGVLRPADTVARLGGDEFVAVCEGLHSGEEATAVADRILAAVSTPFTSGQRSFSLTCSIGISLSNGGVLADELLQEADKAMYLAKRAGKARIQVGDLSDPAFRAQSAQVARAEQLTSDLQLALDREELILYGQPILDLRSGAVVAVENLLRWRHPVHGLLTPDEFLEVAEVGDLMLPIGRWTLQESCRMAASLVALMGVDAPAVHVNLSAHQLQSSDLRSEILLALNTYQLAAAQLILEVPETYLPLIADSVRNDLLELRGHGLRVAIDEIGTGITSLTRITEVPVDILKIDASVIAGIGSDPVSGAVVRGILAIGDALDLDVIADGVESASQVEQLGTYGCGTAQGYLYSRPLPEALLRSYLQSPTAIAHTHAAAQLVRHTRDSAEGRRDQPVVVPAQTAP